MESILDELVLSAQTHLNDDFVENSGKRMPDSSGPYSALRRLLSRWSEEGPRPLVLMIDEIDALIGDSLISVLRQLRSGYTERYGVGHGHLVVFDRSESRSWDEKVFRREKSVDGRAVTVWGM